MKCLVLGAGGMAGHLISLYFLEQGAEVEGLARKELGHVKTVICDATDFVNLKRIIEDNQYDAIINCIGILNQSAEDNKSSAILLNSYLPHFLSDITRNMKTKVIQMSTDCVFSGKRGMYSENDIPDGETYYDRTKGLGELNDSKNLTFRNSIIGPDINQNGIGLFHWFMKQSGEVNGFSGSKWTGVTTLTLAKAMYAAIQEDLCGLYNLVNNEITDKYELLKLFNKYSGKDLIIHKVKGVEQDKSLYRGRNDFSFIVPSYEDQVREMFDWIDKHKNLYNY